jgi:hypothetical protein
MVEVKRDEPAGDTIDIPQDVIRTFYENNEAFRRLWHAHTVAGQRLEVLASMPSPYIRVEMEMLRRRQSALAQQIADLVHRREVAWKASSKAAPKATEGAGTGMAGDALGSRFHPGGNRSAAMAWNRADD